MPPNDQPELRVAMLNEGTYPFVDGGVSTWCHALCEALPNVEFSFYAVTGSPLGRPVYMPSPNARRTIQLPQWGTEDVVEYVLPESGGAAYFRRKANAGQAHRVAHFLPLFGRLLDIILQPSLLQPKNDAQLIVELHRFFINHDYTAIFRRKDVWDCFRQRCMAVIDREQTDRLRAEPTVLDLAVALRWLHNLLMPIAVRTPAVDLLHASVAAVVGLIGLIGKLEHGLPFVLTEHGVYLRERYISVSVAGLPWFQKRVLIGLAAVAARLCYWAADVVAPVCSFNTRWETRLGVPPERLRVIYNGIDPDLFRPGPKPRDLSGRAVVVAAARVSAIKDILTMIRAAEVARHEVPNLLVRVYGSLTADTAYTAECRQLIDGLGLQDNFELAGFHPSAAEIYNVGDISVLSSVTEGFPYTVIESMACQRPVVATDVGGVREALDGFGIVVPPKDPQALGHAMAELLLDPMRRLDLGRRSREQVLARFRIDQAAKNYLEVYRSMLAAGSPSAGQAA